MTTSADYNYNEPGEKPMNALLLKLSARLPCRVISLDSGPYLERYYVGQLFGATFYLHRFVSADTERHLHNHPWTWGRSLIISGSYREEVATDLCAAAGPSGCITEKRTKRWWNRVDGNDFHRIGSAAPGTWSLFFHGERARVCRGGVSYLKGWGFLERRGRWVRFRPAEPSAPDWWLNAPPREVAR
jgi:hypothetical protein